MLSLTNEPSRTGKTSFPCTCFSSCTATQIPRTANISAVSSAAFDDNRETQTKAWLSGSQTTGPYMAPRATPEECAPGNRAPCRTHRLGPHIIQRGRSISANLQLVQNFVVLYPGPPGPIIQQLDRQPLLCHNRMNLGSPLGSTRPNVARGDPGVTTTSSAGRPPEGLASRARPPDLHHQLNLPREAAAVGRGPCEPFLRRHGTGRTPREPATTLKPSKWRRPMQPSSSGGRRHRGCPDLDPGSRRHTPKGGASSRPDQATTEIAWRSAAAPPRQNPPLTASAHQASPAEQPH